MYRVTRSPFQLKMLAGRAPRLIAASLDASLFRITAQFDMATNAGRTNTPGSCAGILTSSLLRSLGSGSACVWETPRKFVVTLGSDTTLLNRLNEEPGGAGVATTIAGVSPSCAASDCVSFFAAECGAVGLVHCGDACVPQSSIIDCVSFLATECGAVGLVRCGNACVPLASGCPAAFAANGSPGRSGNHSSGRRFHASHASKPGAR